ncbi:FecR family protein [Chitinophaga niastensis]|uniref:FecR family protein n=1 Tax=Chitinophaga niastensis TaxID=536980 RepID=A0A2P8HP23_CHINA|nr:FecR domain-containing protein [Chitinophaga niastensis]PSL47964.1 FecR family protein [Chitinophaga niastensis]
MDQDHQHRIKQLLKQYFDGIDHPEAATHFEEWYRQLSLDESLDLSQEELDLALGRMAENIRVKKQPRMRILNRRMLINVSAVAASVLLLVSCLLSFKQGTSFYNLFHPIKEIQLATLAGQSKTLTLPDGSIIHLNENAAVTYTNRYDHDGKREIFLWGEAFFEVTKNPQHPFIVIAGKANITVLGTSFNVSGNQVDSTVVVAVRDGRVALQDSRHADNAAMVLSEGEAGILSKEGALTHYTSSNVANYLSWMNGQLTFNRAALKEVALELEQIYHVPIRLQDTSLEKIHLTLQYRRTDLPAVLDLICNSLNLEHTTRNGVVWISNIR